MAARGIYSIGAVSRMLGVSQSAIRSWEDRYGLIVAERNEGGRRLYTREQLEQLRFVKERLDEGLSAADAHRLLADHGLDPRPVVELPPRNPSTRLLVLLAESDRYGAELSDVSPCAARGSTSRSRRPPPKPRRCSPRRSPRYRSSS